MLVQGLPQGSFITPCAQCFCIDTNCPFLFHHRRNGGYISPNLYNDYSGLKKKHGAPLARQILGFRLAHISTLITVAEQEGLLAESQARVVEEFDVFADQSVFQNAKSKLQAFTNEVQEYTDKLKAFEGREDMAVCVLLRIHFWDTTLTRVPATSFLLQDHWRCL